MTVKDGKIFGKFDSYDLGKFDAADFKTTLGLTAEALHDNI